MELQSMALIGRTGDGAPLRFCECEDWVKEDFRKAELLKEAMELLKKVSLTGPPPSLDCIGCGTSNKKSRLCSWHNRYADLKKKVGEL